MTDTKTLFGTTGVSFGNNIGSEITDAYISVRNAYVAANAAEAPDSYVQTLKSIAYDDGGLGDMQNQSNTPKVSNFETGSTSFPTVEVDGAVLPEGVPAEPADPEAAISKLQSNLAEWFAEPSEVVADGQGRSKLKQRREQQSDDPEPEPEPEPETTEQDDLSDAEQALTGAENIGSGIAPAVLRFLNNNPEEVDTILAELESVESYETAEVDPLEQELSGEKLEMAYTLREAGHSDPEILGNLA